MVAAAGVTFLVAPAGGAGAATTKSTVAGSPQPPPIQDVISEVGNEPDFRTFFAGYTLNSDGTATVQMSGAIPQITAALRSAIPKADYVDGAEPFHVVGVPHSSAALEDLAQRIAADHDSLRSRGIDVELAGVDTQSDTVYVDVNNYGSSAADFVRRNYGGPGWITVQETPARIRGVTFHPTNGPNRYWDMPLWYNGDWLAMDTGGNCTDNFTDIGNNSGRLFQMTAGHCGGNSFWNYGGEIGTKSTNYWNFTGLDFQSIACPQCSALGQTYYEGTWIGTSPSSSIKGLAGWTILNYQALTAYDGSYSGEITDQRVYDTNTCVPAFWWTDNRARCGLYGTVNNQGSNYACQAGDSGGPVYQNNSNQPLFPNAVGLIIGGATPNATTECWYLGIATLLAESNTSLETSAP